MREVDPLMSLNMCRRHQKMKIFVEIIVIDMKEMNDMQLMQDICENKRQHV